MMVYFSKNIFNNQYDGKLNLNIAFYKVDPFIFIRNNLMYCKDCRFTYLQIDSLIGD